MKEFLQLRVFEANYYKLTHSVVEQILNDIQRFLLSDQTPTILYKAETPNIFNNKIFFHQSIRTKYLNFWRSSTVLKLTQTINKLTNNCSKQKIYIYN